MTLIRSIPPVIKPLNMPHILNPVEVQKGIYVFQKPSLQVFKLDLVFNDAGFATESKTQSMGLTAQMLLSGTKQRSSYQLSNELDLLGAYTQIQSDYCKSVLTVYGVQENFEPILKRIHDALNTPLFPESELNIKVRQKIRNLRVQEKKTRYRASKLANSLWFGSSHVLGKQVTEQDYNALNHTDLQAVYSQHFQNLSMVLSGGPLVIEHAELLSQLFPLKNRVSLGYSVPKIQTQVQNKSEGYVIPESNQASIVMRFKAVERNHQDYPALLITNLLFGGYFGSRLMKNIREDKGWTYGIHSVLKSLPGTGYIDVVAEIKGDRVEDVKKEILKEIQHLQEIRVQNDEWNTAKQYYFGMIQRAFDPFFHNSDTFITLQENELDLCWYSYLSEQILKLTPEDVQRIANTYLNTHSLLFTWSGPDIKHSIPSYS